MEIMTVKLKKLQKILQILEDRGMEADDEVSFEFIVGSLFPNVLNNIKEEMRRQHADGYARGLQARKEKELVN